MKTLFVYLLSSELESERRALEESEREKRLLASRLEDLSGRLELSERERREVWLSYQYTSLRDLKQITTATRTW